MSDLTIKPLYKVSDLLDAREPGTAKSQVCTRCTKEKSVDDFYIQAQNTHGRMSYCKTCHKKSVAAYQKRKALAKG